MALATRVALPRRAARIISPYNSVEYQSWFPWLRLALMVFMVVSVIFASLLTTIGGLQVLRIAAIPIALMGGIVIWMLPDADRYARTAVVPAAFRTVLIAYLLAIVIWPNYLAIVLPGLPWITPPRLLLGVMLLMLLMHYPQHSKSRATLVEVLGYDRIAFLLLIIFQVVNLLVIPLSPSVPDTIGYFLLQQVMSLTPVLMAAVIINNEGTIAAIYRALAIGVIFTMAVGVLENFMQSPPWANYIPSFMRIDENFLQTFLSPQARAGDSRYRIRTTFAIVLYYTQYLSLMVPLVLYTIWSARKRYLYIAVPLAVLLLHTIWFTNARTAFISLIVPLFGFAALTLVKLFGAARNRDSLKPGVAVAVVLLLIGLLGGVLATSHRAQMYTFGGAQHTASNDARDVQWENAWRQLKQNPIGIGAGNSLATVGVEVPGKVSLILDSLYINMLVDTGFIGFFCYFAFFLRVGWLGILVYLRAKTRVEEQAGAAALGLISYVIVDYVISTTDSAYVSFLLAGLILATKRLQDERIVAEARAAAEPSTALVRPRAI